MVRDGKDRAHGLPQQESAQENECQNRYHVVQPGENLTMIAQSFYGSEHTANWITLYNHNRELIGENPDIIQPGIELLIPDISEFL